MASQSTTPNPAATFIPTRLPTGSISVTDVCDAYQVARNLRALQTRTITFPIVGTINVPVGYYTPDGTQGSAGTSGSISLGQFRGVYTIACSGNMSDQSASATAGFAGHGVQAVVGFNNCSYTINGEHFYELKINFYAQGNAQGTAASAGYNSQNFSVSYRNISAYTGNQVQSHTFNDLGGAGANMGGQLSITCSTNASNNLGDQVSVSATWVYNVNYNGITGPV